MNHIVFGAGVLIGGILLMAFWAWLWMFVFRLFGWEEDDGYMYCVATLAFVCICTAIGRMYI